MLRPEWIISQKSRLLLCGWLWGLSVLTGCAHRTPVDYNVWTPRIPDQNYQAQPDESQAFDQAGPIEPQMDIAKMLEQKIHTGAYRLIPEDVIEIRMPSVLRTLATDYTNALGDVDNYICRVSSDGTILLPIIGPVKAAGETVAQLEQRIVAGYYPQYLINPPVVVVEVKEYKSCKVTILGAVNHPGLYKCPSNEMSLVSLIMKAGGITDEGARAIRIKRANAASNGELRLSDQFMLPVKGVNIPFADAVLKEGDVVEVEKLNPEVFTVIGLVNRSGSFTYPPGIRYNLLQALAFAGGVNDVAAPRYARIYRQSPDGTVISASFRLKGSTPVDGAAVQIRPGDVIAVEHDFSTRSRLLLAQIFRVTAGVNVYATYNLDTKFNDATTR